MLSPLLWETANGLFVHSTTVQTFAEISTATVTVSQKPTCEILDPAPRTARSIIISLFTHSTLLIGLLGGIIAAATTYQPASESHCFSHNLTAFMRAAILCQKTRKVSGFCGFVANVICKS